MDVNKSERFRLAAGISSGDIAELFRFKECAGGEGNKARFDLSTRLATSAVNNGIRTAGGFSVGGLWNSARLLVSRLVAAGGPMRRGLCETAAAHVAAVVTTTLPAAKRRFRAEQEGVRDLPGVRMRPLLGVRRFGVFALTVFPLLSVFLYE